jgi:hypothetical protein
MNTDQHGSGIKRLWPISVCICAHLWLLGGCASDKDRGPTTRPTSMRQRQDAALRDPFSYKPGIEDQDISGGGIGEFDSDGMKRDIDHVFNP